MSDKEGMTPAPEGKERLTAWAHWKRLELNRIASERDVSKDELWESENGHLEAIEHLLSQARAAQGLRKFVEYVATPEKWPKKWSAAGTVQHLFSKAEDALAAYQKSREG